MNLINLFFLKMELQRLAAFLPDTLVRMSELKIPVYTNKSLRRNKESGLSSADWFLRETSGALVALDASRLGEGCL